MLPFAAIFAGTLIVLLIAVICTFDEGKPEGYSPWVPAIAMLVVLATLCWVFVHFVMGK